MPNALTRDTVMPSATPTEEEIVAAAKARDDKDQGPQFDLNVPFSQKIAVSKYDSDGFVGSEAVFSDLSFAEVPQLANLNRDATGVDISLRRAGNLVILEGRADLTNLNDSDADVQLTVAFPGEVNNSACAAPAQRPAIPATPRSPPRWVSRKA